MINKRNGVQIGLLVVVSLFLIWPRSASARGFLGAALRGGLGVHASTKTGVGYSLPTPEISAGAYGVSATADPRGVRSNYSGPHGVSAGVSSDGDYYGGVEQELPGGVSASGGVNNDEVSGDAMIDDF